VIGRQPSLSLEESPLHRSFLATPRIQPSVRVVFTRQATSRLNHERRNGVAEIDYVD